MMLFSGIIYAWANLSTPLYDFGWSETQLSVNYTLTFFFFAVGQVIAGVLSKKFSPKILLISSGILIVAGFFMTSFLNPGDNIMLLYLFYGIISGSAIGGIYNTVLSVVGLWFPEMKGVCAGILLAGYGISSFSISLVAGKLMLAGIDWRLIYRILSLVTGLVAAFSAFFIVCPENVTLPVTKEESDGIKVKNFTSKEMLKTPSFWLIWLTTPLIGGIGNTLFAQSKAIMIESGAAVNTAVVISSLISVVNSIGRPIGGVLVDRFGIAKTRALACFCSILACGCIIFGVINANSVICSVGMFLVCLNYGFSTTVSSAVVGMFYGPKHSGENLGILNTCSMVISFFPTVFTAIFVSSGTYILPLVFLSASGFVAFVTSFMIRKPQVKEAKAAAAN